MTLNLFKFLPLIIIYRKRDTLEVEIPKNIPKQGIKNRSLNYNV